MKLRRLTFTVTNDLTYDQRMQRICRSLSYAGYQVTLVGRNTPGSMPLKEDPSIKSGLIAFLTQEN